MQCLISICARVVHMIDTHLELPLSLSATFEQSMVGIKELASIPLSLLVLKKLMLKIFNFSLF